MILPLDEEREATRLRRALRRLTRIELAIAGALALATLAILAWRLL